MRVSVAASLAVVSLGVSCVRRPVVEAASREGAVGAAAAPCVVDFDSTYTILTRDYAGYQDRMRESAARISAVADSVRAAVRTAASDSACTATIARWTGIFNEHDHHLQFWQQSSRAGAATTNAPDEGRRPTIRFADESTAVLTLPTFDRAYKSAIDSLVAAHRARLLGTPFLVVDVRRNPGGANASFRDVMALLYTDPIPREGFDLWVSAGMVAAVRPALEDPRIDEARRVRVRAAIQRFEATKEPFFLEGKADEVRYDSVFAMPRRVAVVTGRGCVSSCEQFVLDAMHSRKVTVLGTRNTGGFLDYGDVWYLTLPSGVRRLGVPSSRSRRLPQRPMDKAGVAPDVLIPREEPDAIAYAIRYLRSASAPRR